MVSRCFFYSVYKFHVSQASKATQNPIHVLQVLQYCFIWPLACSIVLFVLQYFTTVRTTYSWFQEFSFSIAQ